MLEENIQSVIIEGGKATLNQFIEAGIWDEARVLTAAKNFEKGLKAPVLNQSPNSIEAVDTDQLAIYYSMKK